MNKPTVAFLGLGIMGGGFYGRIACWARVSALTVYNRNADKTKALAAAGAKVANSPRAAAVGADIIISMVADDGAARAVWLGDNGALAGAKAGAVVVDCSTVTPDWAKELAAAAAKKSCPMLEAPVTGTKPHAAAGELGVPGRRRSGSVGAACARCWR